MELGQKLRKKISFVGEIAGKIKIPLRFLEL
jgi:hypothetical protein